MRVTVFGPGGVGGYLAARLASADVAEVSVVARGRHLEAIARDGLRLESPHGDVHVRPFATDDTAAIGAVDLVLLATKATDVPDAARRLAPLLSDATRVITLQNGVDSPDIVGDVVGRDAVLPGVAYIFSTVAAPGVVRHTAGPGRFVFGPWRGGDVAAARRIGDVLTRAGIENEVVADAAVELWSKFTIICATAGVTTPSRLAIDELRDDPAAWQLFRDLAEETAAVGRATGVALPPETVDRTMAFIAGIGPGAYSSLLYDLLHGKPMELDTLHGTVVRLAEEVGVDVPVTRTIHALLSPWARRNARGTPPVDATSVLTG